MVDHGRRKARLTLEGGGLEGLPAGWKRLESGLWRRTVPLAELGEELERIGHLLGGH